MVYGCGLRNELDPSETTVHLIETKEAYNRRFTSDSTTLKSVFNMT